MKNLLFILFVLAGFVSKAQFPSQQNPTQFSTGWFKQGWPQADSGHILANRLPNFTPRFPGTVILYQQAGVDSSIHYYNGGRWLKLSQFDSTSLSNRINLKLNISDTAAMLAPYFRIADTTNKWVQDVYVRNDSLFKFKNGTETFLDTLGNGGSPSSGLTSVGLSMPSAFTVTNSPLTSNGTLAVSGAGTSLQYIRGNGTLATTDSGMIPNFYLKVRSLLTGTSPITFNQTTGAIGINNATATGTKGAAGFTGAFSDNGSGIIDLLDLGSAGSCTGCNLTIDAKGRITGYADGAGGATNNVNIGTGFRPVNAITQEMRTYFAGFGTSIDSVANANGLTWRSDTTRVTGLPSYFYTDSIINANIVTANNGLTKTAGVIQIGGALIQTSTISTTGSYQLIVTGSNGTGTFRGINTAGGYGIEGISVSGSGVAGNSTSSFGVGGTSSTGIGLYGATASTTNPAAYLSTNPSTTAIAPVLDLVRSTTGTPTNDMGGSIRFWQEASDGFERLSTTLQSKFTDITSGTRKGQFEVLNVHNAVSSRVLAITSAGQQIWDGYPALTPQIDTTTFKPVAVNMTTGAIVPMAGWVGGGGGGSGTVTQVNTGYGLLGGPITTTGTLKVDTAIIDARYPKVYNVVSAYGAVPDGKEKYDGAMTNGSPTLTCVSCVFTAGDVGKAIRVEGAVTNGDLVTTIAGFTSSSVVTLGSNATRTVSGDTLVFGTDNTVFIQNAINDAFLNGDGKVYIPAVEGGGFYVLAGPLITSFAGTNPNAQLVWPVADLGSSSFNARKHVLIEGALPPYNTPSALFGDTLTPKYGTVLYSIIDGSGVIPSVFGTKAPSAGFGNINYNELSFKNLTIFVARNKYNGGPSLGGINGLYSSTTCIENLLVGISGSINKQPEPIHDVAGIIIGRKDSEIYSYVKNTSTFCFKYGFIYTEDVTIDKAIAHASIYGHTLTDGNYPVVAGSLDAHWCQRSLYIPNHNLFGLIPLTAGVSQFSIQYLSCELFNGSSLGAPSWLNYVHVVSDSGSRGRGSVSAWNIGQAEVGLNNTLFNKYGGDSIYTRQVGSQVDPNPHSWTNRTTFNYINKLGASQNNGAEGYFYNWSPLNDASIIRAQPTVANGSQGIYLSPSGTGASSVSPIQTWITLFNTSLWPAENTTTSNTEQMTIASAGTRHYISTSASGTGTVRPLSLETGSNTDQLKLNTDGTVSINGNGTNQLSVIGSSATRVSGYFRNTNAAGSTSFYLDNSRGSFGAYGGMLVGGASDVTGNLFGVSRADRTFIFHDGANGAGMGIGTLNSQPLYFGTDNTERLRIDASGSIVFNNAYSMPTANGTDGYILTAHTGGAATWDAPGGGSGTVTSFSFTDGGGFDGTVSTATTTPALSIIPSFSGLVVSESSAFSAATIGNMLEYNTGTIGVNDVYMVGQSSPFIVTLKSRFQRTEYSVPDANFSTLSSRQEGLYLLPDITGNRTFSMFSGSNVQGQELYIYNANTSGTFSWTFTGIIPEKGSDGTAVSSIVNGVMYHLLGVYVNSTPHWIVVNQ